MTNKPSYSNILLLCDSYKVGMDQMYPPNTEYVYSYIESRGGPVDRTVFFGLQMFIKNYLLTPITMADIDEAEEVWTAHGEPFNRENWEYILNNHSGMLPVKIDAAPEGSVIPTHNVLVTIVNTDPKCFWLPTWLETILLQGVWYPTTVATNSWRCKKVIMTALEKSSDDPVGQIAFKLHDFSFRGDSSVETAAICGAAHLVNFMGTDTIVGVLAARRYYNEKMAGFSIPASEHSTITSWGRDKESMAYANMLRRFAKPNCIVAVVSDSYDLMNAVTNIWGNELKQAVVDSGATVVIRPDSGDPLVVPVDVVRVLSEKFGYTINSKGYKVLPACVRVIQGDGITVDTLPIILDNLLEAGFSADNIAFGMGGGLGQKVDRDTFRFAMKCSSVFVDGEWRDVFKDPITDSGKRSKKGLVKLWKSGKEYETSVKTPTCWSDDGFGWEPVLQTVFENGNLLIDQTFSEIRLLAS